MLNFCTVHISTRATIDGNILFFFLSKKIKKIKKKVYFLSVYLSIEEFPIMLHSVLALFSVKSHPKLEGSWGLLFSLSLLLISRNTS